VTRTFVNISLVLMCHCFTLFCNVVLSELLSYPNFTHVTLEMTIRIWTWSRP